MKKILLPVLAAALLAGCAKESDNTGNTENGLVPIRLGAGVENTLTKAATDGPIHLNDKFTAGIGGWESTTTPTYGTATWYSTANITASTTPQAVVLSPGQNYNSSETFNTYIKAWHPEGQPNASGIVTIADNTTGNRDVMIADVVSGNKDNIITDNLNFKHLTSQLIFQVQEGITGVEDGTTLDYIEVQGAQLPTAIDLTDNSVDYTAAAPLKVNYTANSTEVTSKPATIGVPMMIAPMNELKVIVKTNNTTYDEATVQINGAESNAILAGHAYTITLTLGRTGITLKATVTDWIPATGSAELQ